MDQNHSKDYEKYKITANTEQKCTVYWSIIVESSPAVMAMVILLN